MIGLSDRGAIRNLLGLLLSGDAPAALSVVKEQYDLGVEPAALLRGLLESVHGITRAKVGGAVDLAQSKEERDADADRSEEHTSDLQSIMRNSYAVLGLEKKKKI